MRILLRIVALQRLKYENEMTIPNKRMAQNA